MLLYGLEQDNYKDSTQRITYCNILFVKKILIHQYYNTTDKQPFKFFLYYSHLLPSKRKECSSPPRKVSIQTQLYLMGWGVYLTAVDILGDVRKRLRARGDICHLAHFTMPALRTPIPGQGAVIFSRVAQQN